MSSAAAMGSSRAPPSKMSRSSGGSVRALTWCARRCTSSRTGAGSVSPSGPRARLQWRGRSCSTVRPSRGRSGTPRRVSGPRTYGGGCLALLDGLGEDDLLLRGQERHLADLLEVHADGVVGRRLEGEVVVAGRAGLAGELLGVELVHHLDDLDVLVGEDLVDVVDLLSREIDGSQRLDHLFGGDEAALLPLDDEVAYLVDLGFLGHGHRVRYLSCRTNDAGRRRCSRCAQGGTPSLRAAAPAGLAVGPRG